MPLLHVDDAIDYLVQFLAREIRDIPRRVFTPTSETKYGCDLWIPNIVRGFWRARQSSFDTLNHEQLKPYYQPFYDAAWELCRIGVLRPGEVTPAREHQVMRGFGGDGYSLTLFGSEWVQKAATERPLIDPGRYGEVIKPFTDRFGVGFAQRAAEAAHCHRTNSYLACCAMAGAAAESILLAVAIAKVGDEAAVLADYRRAAGRKKITDQITRGLARGLAEQFRTGTELSSHWRDAAAHGTATTISEIEAQHSLSQLLRFAQLTWSNWKTLTDQLGGS